ncbi:MAG TPA: tetratricopeptide repeat protein [Bacillota bacterium]|nr:tetratricopeptide repeat protein [Bacillota bacterium]
MVLNNIFGKPITHVSMYRTIDEIFELATGYANDGEYPKAIAQIKKVLDLDPNYPGGQESFEKWREYARISGVPKGSNPYARAKRVQLIEKDLDRAALLFRTAINQGDSIESAVKDLAALLVQQGKPQEAIEIMLKNRKRIQDQKSVDNMLIGFYQNAGQYDKAIELLQVKFEQASTRERRVQVLWQIANNYLRQQDYVQAENHFRTVLRLQPDNKAAQRNVAICLFKQERYDDAERVLNRILNMSPDSQAAELLEAIIKAKATGQFAKIDEIIIETTLTDLPREISGFTQFFLDRCEYQGVPPDRVQKQSFNRTDIQKLEELATKSGTIRPRDRAGHYLSAAKIASIIDEEDPNQFYRYLCRSFASRGDAAVIENKPLDAAREFYCEALSVYDGCRSRTGDERDAVNALVRFLFSTLGQAQIPIRPNIPSIDETLEDIVNRHPQRDKVFDYIALLVFRSRFAANRVLNRLYYKSSLQAMALEYLKNKGIGVINPIKQLDDFVRLWDELRRKNFDEVRSVSNELRFLKKVELTTASLENAIVRAKGLSHRLFFDLDLQRIIQLQKILETALDLCKQIAFEEQERLCFQIDGRCHDLLQEIEGGPTKLSVEEMYPVIEAIQIKINARLEELYRSSTPQLLLRLPVESYTPDNNQCIEVQIVVYNEIGCSPAEALELIAQEDEDFFVLNSPEIRLDSSLRGGDQRIFKVPIRVSEQALNSQTFSLPVYAQYRTRSGEITQTPIYNFSIRLYSQEEFEEIENHYAAYAEGGVVGDPDMFYGREELIENAARAILESRKQSKCIVIFGQKRAGKSSILHHLSNKLQAFKELIILDMGNIGSIIDEHSQIPFIYQILWSILDDLKSAIENRINKGFSPLNIFFPDDFEFYAHPSPLMKFKDIFSRYKLTTRDLEDWRNLRIVVLIDEFSYIYEQIVNGKIPEEFMKNWKAILQENYFSAVLVGQDVMAKFKQRFPNEFGTTQDERVSYLKRDDAIKLIDEPIRIGGRQGQSRYRERAIERIIDLTAGSPFYIQIICNRLVEYMNRKRARLVTEADVEQVKEELIRGVNALKLYKFDNLINSGDASVDAISDEDALKVLTMIAVNSQTGACNRNNITCKTKTNIDLILDDLVKREVVERDRGQYYSIRVGLFKEWLIANQ